MGIENEKKYLKDVKFNKYFEKLSGELENKSIMIYGAGILFEAVNQSCNLSKFNITGVMDQKFEAENAPAEFLGFKTCKIKDIADHKPDCILVAVKNYQPIISRLSAEYPDIKIMPLVRKKHVPAFERRNIRHNIWIDENGLHGKKRKNLNAFQKLETQIRTRLNSLIGRIEIPQIEFNITTKCSLRCKHCSNFIPRINPEEHCLISIEEFKTQVDNLLKAVHKVKNLLLIGGEPLLVKNIAEYLEYAASKNKIERVWIVTNGTILMNEDLIKTAVKYRNKVTIWLSNYSKNEDLKNKLKHEEFLKQIRENNLDYDYVQDLTWGYTSEMKKNKLREESESYFEECGINCVAVFGGKIYVCPRAGVFVLKGIYTPQIDEVIDLNIENKPGQLKKKLKDFYSREAFSACNYCSVMEDRGHDRIMPAIQLEK